MNSQIIHKYSSITQKINLLEKKNQEDSHLQKIIQAIEENIQRSPEGDLKEFFKAERAFSQKQYKVALKHYLIAKNIPQISFYCHRVSALIYYEMHDISKAYTAIEKALSLFPKDSSCLFIRDKINKEQATIAAKKTSCLDDQDHSSPETSFSLPSSLKEISDQKLLEKISLSKEKTSEEPGIFLGEEEVNDLEALFENEEELKKGNREKATDFQQILPTCFDLSSENDFFEKDEETSLDFPSLEEMKNELLEDELNAQSFSVSYDDILLDNLDLMENESTDKFNLLDDDQKTKLSSWEEKDLLNNGQYSEEMKRYIEEGKNRTSFQEESLQFFKTQHHIPFEKTHAFPNGSIQLPSFLQDSTPCFEGSYLRWNNKGILINPGKDFIQHFHQRGFYIRDIDKVIVSNYHPHCLQALENIYTLNYQHNCVSPQVHLIHYYLDPQTFKHMSSKLVAHFKKERETLHSLELYEDSLELETLSLDPLIELNYFYLESQPKKQHLHEKNSKENSHRQLALSLSLCYPPKHTQSASTFKIILLEDLNSSLPINILKDCDVLILNTPLNPVKEDMDITLENYQNVLKDVSAKLLLSEGLMSSKGDYRLSGTEKLRQKIQVSSSQTLLPIDSKLSIHLDTYQIRCCHTNLFVPSNQIGIYLEEGPFSSLNYIHQKHFLAAV